MVKGKRLHLSVLSLGYTSVGTLPMQYSYFDRLKAFRITPLGEYQLGKTKQYEPSEQEQLTRLSFDESSPIIRIEGNIELGDAMLANYATKVSENRYQFSPGKFLKDCKTGKDLHRIVAQDEILRSIVIKAEQFTIIVADVKNAAFINRMKELGYQVE